jgi:hypothetical protein
MLSTTLFPICLLSLRVLVGAEEEVEKEQGHHIVIPTTHPILSSNTLTNIHPS